jgi:hypothetical protein
MQKTTFLLSSVFEFFFPLGILAGSPIYFLASHYLIVYLLNFRMKTISPVATTFPARLLQIDCRVVLRQGAIIGVEMWLTMTAIMFGGLIIYHLIN